MELCHPDTNEALGGTAALRNREHKAGTSRARFQRSFFSSASASRPSSDSFHLRARAGLSRVTRSSASAAGWQPPDLRPKGIRQAVQACRAGRPPARRPPNTTRIEPPARHEHLPDALLSDAFLGWHRIAAISHSGLAGARLFAATRPTPRRIAFSGQCPSASGKQISPTRRTSGR